MQGIHSGNSSGWTSHPFGIDSTGEFGSPGPVFPKAIHFWPMNEGSGSTFYDQIGTLNFTVTNPFWGVLAGMGSSAVAEFNNASPTFAVASGYDASLDFSGTQSWTVAFWAYPTVIGTFLSNIESPSFTGGWEVGGGSPVSDIAIFAGINDGSHLLAVQNGGITLSVAQFIVATYDGSNTLGGCLMYVNGSAIAMGTLGNTFTPPGQTTQPFQIGLRANSTNPYGGGLAYMRVWNQVLTQAQITTLYGKGPQ
jgi:Concanavalin A-like lectin/glucanases superfamily